MLKRGPNSGSGASSRRVKRGSWSLVVLLVLASAVQVAAAGLDPVEEFLQSLPPYPPGAHPRTTRTSISLPAAGYLTQRAEQLVGSGAVRNPFWVIGAGLPRKARFSGPSSGSTWLLPVLAVRNPAAPRDAKLHYSVAFDSAPILHATMPPAVIRIWVWVVDALKEFSADGDATVTVLDSGQSVALMWIEVTADAWQDHQGRWRPAGLYRYRGTFTAEGMASSMLFSVELEPYLQIKTEPKDGLKFCAAQPGRHEAVLTVKYQANYSGWRLIAEVTEVAETTGGEAALPRERLEYWDQEAWRQVPAGPFPLAVGDGGGLWREAEVAFRVWTTWDDPAGTFRGSLRLTVDGAIDAQHLTLR